MAELDTSDAEGLRSLEHIVVVMMENRSFDHVLGALALDARYPGRAKIDGLTGNETNPDASGNLVKVYRGDIMTEKDPPHSWNDFLEKWNKGALDGFVRSNAKHGELAKQAMAYHDREQLPITYWLADNFTVCDRWFASCWGPTAPNRRYLHAGTARGIKNGSPFSPFDVPRTLLDALHDEGIDGVNYYVGSTSQYATTFYTRAMSYNPTKKHEAFFEAAKNGTLPPFVVIDPDYDASDDHPNHDMLRGQVFIGTVMKALMSGPQWKKMLVLLTYDESGGFYDHVSPTPCDDDAADFRHLGLRVPALAIGPMVQKGQVVSTVLEHTSIGATLGLKYKLKALSKRMSVANDLTSVFDPVAVVKPPSAPPTGMPVVTMRAERALRGRMGAHTSSQPYMHEMIAARRVFADAVDMRSAEERTASWMRFAQEYEVVKLV